MRHLTEVRDIPDLVYTDDYSIRALDENGATLWTKRFPHMLMQTYYASNRSFIMIRNVHSVTTGDHSLTEGLNLLTMGAQPAENHVLLALLFSPTSHPSIPLLESKPQEDLAGRRFIPLEEVGESNGTAWPLVPHNDTDFPYGRWDPPFSHDTRSVHHLTLVQELVVLLATIASGLLLVMAYKWAEHWYGGDDKPAEAVQVGFAKSHAPLPVEVSFPLSLHPPTDPGGGGGVAHVAVARAVRGGSVDGVDARRCPCPPRTTCTPARPSCPRRTACTVRRARWKVA